MHLSAFAPFLCLILSDHVACAVHSQQKGPSVRPVADRYFQHSAASRINTDTVIYRLLTERYPQSEITIVPGDRINLLAYAAAGKASSTACTQEASIDSYSWRSYSSPLRRPQDDNGTLFSDVKFGVYEYVWQDTTFTVYVVDGRDGLESYSAIKIQYLIGPSTEADKLLLAAGHYGATLHDEIWVFENGYWDKDATLWANMNKSSWDNVILDENMKTDLIGNVLRFFDSEDQYKRLGVPWKRGVIFHGPPGNGKTISIKATMHTLYSRPSSIPTLYVKTLSGYGEYALSAIFKKARAEAPCYLVFEDLDSLVTGDLRSYFLNQVDGLQDNDGILMVGSTNHLERLDPGIAKRPSRFDRKFFFPNPSLEQRVQYCQFWRRKLEGNKDVVFPVVLTEAIANITDDFSFAYMQEAFVASLLLIAGGSEDDALMAESQSVEDGKTDLEHLRLWRVIQAQVKELRKELNAEQVALDEAREEHVAARGNSQFPLGRTWRERKGVLGMEPATRLFNRL